MNNIRKRNYVSLTKEELEKVKAIIAKIEPSIKEVDKPDWEELKKITTTFKDQGPQKSHMITATIIDKTHVRYKKGEDEEGNSIKGQNYWKLELDNRDYVFVFHSVLDNPLARKIGSKEYDEIASSLNTGNRYEFEVQKSPYGYHLKNARLLN